MSPNWRRGSSVERCIIDRAGEAGQPTLAGAGLSAAGRPRLSIRLMVGLLYLKHAYNESDELVCERWAQDVYFQYFCGEGFPAAPAMRSDRPRALSAGAGRSRC